MIRFADKSDIPSLRNIWHISFGDSEEYINMFMENRFEKAKTVVCEENGEAAAMFFLFPCEMIASGKGYPSLYLYAAATLPNYRGRGIMGNMLSFAEEYAGKSGFDFIILSPAEESLYGYYRRFGFIECFRGAEIYIEAKESEKNPLKASDNNTAEGFTLRNRIIKACGGVLWDNDFFNYAVYENEFSGGKSFLTDKCCGIYFKDKNRIVFKELIAETAEEAVSFARALCENENCKSAELTLPLNMDGAGDFVNSKCVNTGMAVPLNDKAERAFSGFDKNAYLGLTLG